MGIKKRGVKKIRPALLVAVSLLFVVLATTYPLTGIGRSGVDTEGDVNYGPLSGDDADSDWIEDIQAKSSN